MMMMIISAKYYFFFSSYKILQSSDYDDTRLITGENLCRHRSKKLAHLSLKHISLLGVIRQKLKKKKKRKTPQKRVSVPGTKNHFLFDEAVAAENYDSDEEGLIDEEDSADEAFDENEGYDAEGELIPRGLSESEEDTDSSADEEDNVDDEDEDDNEEGDLNEQLIKQAESRHLLTPSTSKKKVPTTDGEHPYAISPHLKQKSTITIHPDSANWKKKASRYKYSFLYSMVVSGVGKQIKNCIPRGVAVLSNSKTIILSHVNAMLECLDPRLAEICYMDTDSCIFSLTHEKLEDNLLVEKMSHWKTFDIIADESGDKTCHGKMKLEGTFKVGLFKALKIYRLFSSVEFEKELQEKTCYTRCKGVNRNIATLIPNNVFDQQRLNQVVVHRSCLRPSRTGEMLIAHECKSLAAPFNLKRFVTEDGLHTFPISYVPDDEVLMETEENGDAGILL
jgi:hypothetical protein